MAESVVLWLVKAANSWGGTERTLSIHSLAGVAREKRERQRAKRQAKKDSALPALALTDADFDQLLVEVTVRADCEHASTRSTPDGLVLIRCAKDVAVGGGCPIDCATHEPRRIGGLGAGT